MLNMFVQTQRVGKPERRTEDIAASLFRVVLRHRPGYARGLGEMVIPKST